MLWRAACIGSLCAALLAVYVSSAALAASGVRGSPRLINLFLNWHLREEDLPQLARWDVVVLDADQQVRYPDRVRKLRLLNPSIKILAYVPSEEIADARFSEPPEYPFAKLAASIREEWYVRDPSGKFVSFWPGTRLLDVTDRGQIGASGERWQEFFPRFLRDEILSSGLWDGIFLDNTFDSISPFVKTPVDLDRDGRADTSLAADRVWRMGMTKLLRRVRELNPNAILVGNGGAVYAGLLNGAFFEHFPSWNWKRNWTEFRESLRRNLHPSVGALNVNTDNADRPQDYRLMRFGLASALVGGGYYSFDKGDQNHDVMWWYDEYETPLGDPSSVIARLSLSAAEGRNDGEVWSREFRNGLVVVNGSDSPQRVDLQDVFEKLRGRQDASVNNGSLITTLELSARDGAVLLRRAQPTQIRGAAFANGSFVRVYTLAGTQARNGFFAQRRDAPSGAVVAASDVDQDGLEDLVIVQRGVVTIRFGRGGSRTLYPFGRDFTGSISLAVGNVNLDPELEIIVARDGAAPEVLMFSAAGRLLARWEAYQSKFRGGVRVAVGDLDGNGMREIVTGAGPGGGPHIRTWKTDGTVWGGGFFAFNETERGGVSIAVGDVDGDGIEEIIVGSGQGAIPRVRVFDGRGTLKGEIRLGTQTLSGGLSVFSADIDGDGKAEIFVGGLGI